MQRRNVLVKQLEEEKARYHDKASSLLLQSELRDLEQECARAQAAEEEMRAKLMGAEVKQYTMVTLFVSLTFSLSLPPSPPGPCDGVGGQQGLTGAQG